MVWIYRSHPNLWWHLNYFPSDSIVLELRPAFEAEERHNSRRQGTCWWSTRQCKGPCCYRGKFCRVPLCIFSISTHKLRNHGRKYELYIPRYILIDLPSPPLFCANFLISSKNDSFWWTDTNSDYLALGDFHSQYQTMARGWSVRY